MKHAPLRILSSHPTLWDTWVSELSVCIAQHVILGEGGWLAALMTYALLRNLSFYPTLWDVWVSKLSISLEHGTKCLDQLLEASVLESIVGQCTTCKRVHVPVSRES